MKLRPTWPRRGGFRAAILALLAVLVASSAQLQPPAAQAIGTASGTYFATYAGSEDLTSIQAIQRQGVQAVRVYIEWALLEPTIDYNLSPTLISTTDLANYDSRIAALKAAGIRPILMIGRAPNWAAPRERGPLFLDKYPNYVTFLQKIVARWSASGYDVHHWELWPEPDFGDIVPSYIREPAFTEYQPRRAWGDNGVEFANMLKVAYPAIKGVDPTSTVILGSLAFDFFRDNGAKAGDNASCPGFNCGGPFVYHFLTDVLNAGGGCCFDWMGFNAYSSLARGWETNQNYSAYDVAAKAKHIQGVLAAKGVSKPLIVLEAGMPSCCPVNQVGFHLYTKPDKSTGEFYPDERIQGAYMARLYARGLSVDLKGIAWWLIRDFERPNVEENPDNHRGWYRAPDLSAKPSQRVFQLMTSRLAGATFGGSYTPQRVISGEVEAYSFTKPSGATVIMMFSPYGPVETATVQVQGRGFVVYNAFGESVATTSQGGNVIQLTVGYTPVYLETFGSLGNGAVVPLLPKSTSGV